MTETTRIRSECSGCVEREETREIECSGPEIDKRTLRCDESINFVSMLFFSFFCLFFGDRERLDWSFAYQLRKAYDSLRKSGIFYERPRRIFVRDTSVAYIPIQWSSMLLRGASYWETRNISRNFKFPGNWKFSNYESPSSPEPTRSSLSPSIDFPIFSNSRVLIWIILSQTKNLLRYFEA